jgi:hypothetical protein
VTAMNIQTITETTSAPLTNADRCDRCGVAARTRVTLPTGGELLFCGHHTRAHAPRLLDLGAMLSR